MDESPLIRMRNDWDTRARENAQHYVATGNEAWDEREFNRSGEIDVANEVLPEVGRICGGSRSPLDLRVLEIGYGAGRMTRMLARVFGQVVGVDVSDEMRTLARARLADLNNVDLILGDGATLKGVQDDSCDFAFSFIVFQHIPSMEIIAGYCREVHRVLRPGSLFKFQLNGSLHERKALPDTWQGVSFTEADARGMCHDTGFIFEASHGAGDQYFWLWFRKPWSSSPEK